jgi:hypothetical protein
MKLQELKNKIKTEDFDTVCLLVYESIVENKITQEQFLGLMSEIMNEFEGQIGEDDFNESFDDENDLFDNYDDEDLDENY